MRKTSHDGGDATSATSGVENEIRKPKAGLLMEFKSKKIAKRTANLSEESDDAVVEPLLQKTTDKALQSAKYFAKAKADTVKEISKMFNDKKANSSSTSGFGTTESLLSDKDHTITKPIVTTSAPLHNYMNINVFHSHDSSKANGTAKTQVLVEIDASKQSGYNPCPLIFTTAKIHTDGKSKQMEPVQMTPAPILSTIEVSVSKGGNIKTNEKKISNGSSVMNTVLTQPHFNEKNKESTIHISGSNLKSNIDQILKDNNSNPITHVADKANSASEVSSHSNKKADEGSANILKLSNIASVAPSKDVTSSIVNSSKGSTSLAEHSKKTGLSSGTSKSIDGQNKLDSTKDATENKKLLSEPRILMSESKMKPTTAEITEMAPISTKPLLEPLKELDPSSNIPKSVQSNKTDGVKSEKNKSGFDQHTKLKNEENINSKPLSQSNNVKSPVGKPNTSKSLQPKNTQAEPTTSNISDTINDTCAKTLSSSSKIPTQYKNNDNKLSKEIDKSPKPSANKINNSKISLNSASDNKLPTSASTVKPAQNASPAITSSNITINSNKAYSSSPNHPNTSIATVASSIKAQSSGLKTSIAKGNTNLTSVNATKSIEKVSAVTISSPLSATATVNTNPASVATTKSTAKVSAISIKSPLTATTVENTIPASVTTTNSTAKVSAVSTKSPLTATTTENTNPALVTATKSTAKVSAGSIKSPITATSTGNKTPSSITNAKSTKVSTASIKSPSSTISTTSAAKQPNISTKTSSIKPPSLAFTKTPQVNTSSPGVSPIAKTAVSKVTQINTNTGQKSNLPSTPITLGSTSSSHSELSNKTKAQESIKKVVSKLSNQAIDTKTSK